MTAKLLLLGPPRLDRDEHTAHLDTRKALALLAYLSLNNQEYQRDSLTALLWPELPQSRARAALRRTLTPLNKALGEDGLITTRETVAINDAFEFWVDACAFQQEFTSINAHDHTPKEVCPRCIEPLENCLALYRGSFMEGFSLRDSPPFDDWQVYESERFRRMLAQVLERLTIAYSRRGDAATAIDHARHWLALDNLHEPAYRTLMLLYAQTGQRSKALKQYREALRILDQELGVPPLEETTRLYEDILENRIETVVSTTIIPDLAPDRSNLTVRSDEALPFVGRTQAWSVLKKSLQAASEHGRLVVVEGEMGIGKTRLANEFARYAAEQGSRVLQAQCYEGEMNLAYAPIQTALRAGLAGSATNLADRLQPVWLAAVARLLPELAQPGMLPELETNPLSAQSRLFESVRQVLASLDTGTAPVVLILDDLQWADSASIDLLAFLIRRIREHRLFILLTWRSENVPADHGLRVLYAEAIKSNAGALIGLERLSREEVDQLAEHFRTAPDAVRKNLFATTEGLPFFVIEYLNSGFDGRRTDLPRGVREIQKARLAVLDETGKQLITTAAVIGRSFDFDTIKTASGRSDEETVRGLESLVAGGLLYERNGESGGTAKPHYDFSHETIHQVAYEQTSLARRRLLHRRVADALMSFSSSITENAGRIAYHLQQTGADELAAEYHIQAGDHARSVYANNEALKYYETALALKPDQGGEIHEAIGDLLTLGGEYRKAVMAYERSAGLSSPEKLPRIEQKLGNLHHRRGDYELAASHFEAAADLLQDQPANETLALVLADWSRTAAQTGDLETSAELAGQGLQVARKTGHAIAISQAQNILGVVYRKQANYEKARSRLTEALEAAGENLHARIAAMNNLALVLADQDQHQEAIQWIRKALDDCRRLGDRHREAALRNHLADRLHAVDEQEEAMAHLKLAVEIFADIGTDSGELQPEIWKLTEW